MSVSCLQVLLFLQAKTEEEHAEAQMIVHHWPERSKWPAQLIVISEINKVPFRIIKGDNWKILIDLSSGGTSSKWVVEMYKTLVFRWESFFFFFFFLPLLQDVWECFAGQSAKRGTFLLQRIILKTPSICNFSLFVFGRSSAHLFLLSFCKGRDRSSCGTLPPSTCSVLRFP